MKIKRIGGNESVADYFDKAITELEQLLDDYFEADKDNNTGFSKTNEECRGCKLEWFYYYCKSESFKKAIWVKVNNLNKVNIWIRIGVNKKEKKKVNIYSDSYVGCVKLTKINTKFPTLFMKNDIFISDKRKEVKLVTFQEILNEICNNLFCVCNAKTI